MSELFALGRKRGIRSLRRRSANAFALTYRFPAPSHWCLARILTSGGVPELRPDTAHWAFAGQPLGNSFAGKRSLPLVLRRFVRTAPTAVERRKSNRRFYILPPFKIESSRQYHCVRQEDSARDFASKKDIFPQEYFVYFKGK